MKLRHTATAIAALTILGCACGLLGLFRNADTEPKAVSVPNLVGKNMDTVRDQLNKLDLEGNAKGGDWDADHIVISTKPKAGTTVAPYSTIQIVTASRGEIAFYAKPMPNLIGRNWLDLDSPPTKAIYLNIKTEWQKTSRKPGTIVNQTPKPGTKLRLGQPIRVTVADYPSGSSGGSWDAPNVNGPNVCRRTKWC